MPDTPPTSAAPMTPGERLREAAYRLRTGAPIPVALPQLRTILAATLDQEAIWADDRSGRYPDAAPMLALAEAMRNG